MKFSRIKKVKIGKTWVVLGVALVIGVAAALAARSYLSSQMAAIEARSKGEQVHVVVAKRELRRGDPVSSDTVAVRAVPVDYAHSSALRPGELDRFDGQSLSYGVKPGEMILWSMLEGKKAPTFSARVEEGHRAITVPVDEINSISGLLEPGDLIDLMVTIGQKDKKFTFPLLQTVRVIATGQRSVDDPKSGERRSYSTVTLDVTPEQAQNVIVAREAGKVTALLRNPGDTKVFRGGSNDLAMMLGLQPESESRHAETASSVRQVPVLYGGRSAKLPPEGLEMGRYVHANTGPVSPAAPSGPASGMATANGHDPEINTASPVTPTAKVMTSSSVRQP